MQIVGHRGARGLALENSARALKAGMQSNAHAIEFDIHATKDEVLVVHHDPTILRIYGKDLAISESTYDELVLATKDHPDPLITLDEAMGIVGDYPIFIELKDIASAKLLHKNLANFPKAHVKAVISFYTDALMTYRASNGQHPIYLAPTRLNWLTIVHRANKIQADGVVPHYSCLVSPLHLIWARLSGLDLFSYPINYYFLAKYFKLFNKNVYICTDYPDRFIDTKEG